MSTLFGKKDDKKDDKKVSLLNKVPAPPPTVPIVKLPPHPTTHNNNNSLSNSTSGSTIFHNNNHNNSSTTTTPNSTATSSSGASNVSSSPTTNNSPILGGGSRASLTGSTNKALEDVKKNSNTVQLSSSGGSKNSSPYRQSTTLSQLTSQSNSDSSPPSSLFSNSSSPTNESLVYQDNDSSGWDPNTKMGNFVGGLKVTSGGEQPRSGHSASLFDDSFYIFGGVGLDNVATNDFFSFNFLTKTWTTMSNSNGPSARSHHTSIVYNNSMYIFGGEGNSLKNDLFVYSFDTQLWSEVQTEGTKPTPRFGHSAIVEGSTMVIFGGVVGSQLCNDVYTLNLDTRQWTQCPTTNAPSNRAFHSVTNHKGVMYVIGGQDASQITLDDVQCLTIATKEWRPLQVEGSFPGRSHHSAVLLQDSIIISGGTSTKPHPHLDVYELDLYVKKWFRIQTTSQGQNRSGHTSLLKGFSLFLYGGCQDTSLDYFSFGKDEFEDLIQEDDGEITRMQNIPKALWESTLMKKHPEILELRERTQFLTGVKSYGKTLALPSFTENKTAITHQFVLQLIMEYLERHTQNHKTIQSIEKESGVVHQMTESGESRLVTILRLVKPRLRNKNVLDQDLQVNPPQETFDEEVQVVDNLYRRLESEEDVNVWDEGEDNPRNIKRQDGENGKIIIKSATLNKLIQYLAPEKEKTHDVSFMKTFLYTHQSFTTSETLLKKLIQRYSGPINADPQKKQDMEPIKKRVCDVLKYWIDKCPWDFKSGPNADKLVASLNNFIDGALTRDGSSSVKNLRRILGQARTSENTTSMVYSTNPPDPKVPKNIFSPQLTLAHIDELEIARQLTLIEYKIFRNIPPPEFLVRVTPFGEFQYSMATSPNLIVFLNRSSDVTKWVVHNILQLDQKKLRAKMIEKYIKIMESLRSLNNFQTLYSICQGLQHPTLHTATVGDIFTARSKEVLQETENLFSKADNYKNYREVLSKSSPCIPLVHVIQEDIAFIEKEQPSMTNVLVNFVKRQNLCNIIYKAEAYQVHSYNLQPVHQVSTFVNKLPKVQENDLYELARKETN